MSYQSEKVNCQNCKNDFIIEPDDFSFYEKIKVPPPTFCPECRMIRRLVFRNERRLFKVQDYFTKKNIFSIFPKESERKVITQEEWFSDDWDAMDYARPYDFSRPFFEQILELSKDVPIYGLNVKNMINSDYCANASDLKNCYLLFNSNLTEDSMYGNGVDSSKDCVDNSNISESERCYETFWLNKCYQCYYSIMCVDSYNLWFSRDCLGCNDCFGCTNLRKSSYCIFNKQYSKEEYFEKLKEFKLDTREGINKARELAREFWKTQPNKYHQGLQNLNSNGAYVSHSKNVKESYLVRESENMKYCQYMLVPKNKDCMDVSTWGQNTELCYETSVCGENAYNTKFSWDCWPNTVNVEYSISIKSSSDCFGCVGLKKKQYCILNKQYSKEEYFEMVEKIKKHMNDMPYINIKGNIYKYGEFFPIEFSPYGYNNTAAQDQVPLNMEQALKNHYPWLEIEKGEYDITISAKDLPQNIKDVTDEILNEVISCSNCNFAYRIIASELNFYRKENLPLPDLCTDCRYNRRISDRLKAKLYKRNCNKCSLEIMTGFSEDEIVYCERCYQNEVY